MTQEEKRLLLQDLCARLLYGVKVLGPWKKDGPCELSAIDLTSNLQVRVFEDWFSVEDVKPYLRSMSSMTEDEMVEFKWLNSECDKMLTFNYIPVEHYRLFDWLNRNHFDYRGLIEKGLALEAPDGMYNLKKK